MTSLRILSDYQLKMVFYKAIEKNLEKDFIELLNIELKNRGIDVS
ncbi:sporulation histidine kinase inhibitor Sda [Robertmurraya sp. DFI.2.37]|nr:sporulation histidine kinase inhibitor Sda [Robertmurraya sp. DFI.2.37]MDF1507813.1 sporulation histidine kinase inhibitor Sda [Robertmurraya sp. DFI.2.37]